MKIGAGMTYHEFEKAHIRYVHLSCYFNSPKGERFSTSPKSKLNFRKPAAEAVELCRHLIPITRDDGIDRLA